MTKKTTPETRVAKALLKRKTPLTREALCKLTGLDARHSREVIERLRRQGLPIVTRYDVAGYWIAKDDGELDEYLKRSARRINSEMKTNRAMKMDKIEEMREVFNV